MSAPQAAIITIGSELVEGVRIDTNTAEIAQALGRRGLRLTEALSCGDDIALLAGHIKRLTRSHDLVITTGGLGPTHDDITRAAAAEALYLELHSDPRLEAMLTPSVDRHAAPEARQQILRQAQVIDGSTVIDPVTGTAPGLIVPTICGMLAMLPGPPAEMRPMLPVVLESWPIARARMRDLGVAGMTESDAQVRAQQALGGSDGISLTVLARPGDVRVLLFDEGAGDSGLDVATDAIRAALGDSCYSSSGETLAQVVVEAATRQGLMLVTAESCTGGMIAAALTDVPGASACFTGSAVTYADSAKMALLGVEASALDTVGAVSREVAEQMARGALAALDADVSVAVTGIAGPAGGSADKPVGTVWFSVARRSPTDDPSAAECVSLMRRFRSDRNGVRERTTIAALDALRRSLNSLPLT